jgi:hypothetical protein
LKCAVVSLYSVVKQRLKCNTGKVCKYLVQFLLYRRSWTHFSPPFISAQQLSKRTVELSSLFPEIQGIFVIFNPGLAERICDTTKYELAESEG